MQLRFRNAITGERRQGLWSLIITSLVISGCSLVAVSKWDDMYGPAQPRDRLVAADSDAGQHFLTEVQPMLEQRCVVCHGCYDSPCQLNMASPEGIDRGASKDKVYESARLGVAPLTRMFEDAQTTVEWRAKKFWPVLNERDQTPQANLDASVMHHMLALKRNNPLPEGPVLDEKEFGLSLNSKQFCANPDELVKFDKKYPLLGMPYALPNLPEAEFATLEQWLEEGAQMAVAPMADAEIMVAISDWEAFLNGDSLKQQLMSRYIYEHWFLANLYFRAFDASVYFKLVRSATPPGQPVELIATRRPYDDPGVDRVYYRFRSDHATVLDKTHMPYGLDTERMVWLQSLFLDADYTVAALPSYEPEIAANPFIAYQPIPIPSRWQFLRAEAQFTIMNFIKGPVCRGQIAVDVIRDNFWVFFGQTDLYATEAAADFLAEQEANLRIPAEAGSKAATFRVWEKYSKSQGAYLQAKSKIISEYFSDGRINLDLVWDGDGNNQNAALTVFRHFDSASIVKGLVGPPPRTAWLIDYPVLERIHYLLVAGFDVYGNLGHQVNTRLYMDFLRIEGEANFLGLLPVDARNSEARNWYEGASKRQQSYLFGAHFNNTEASGISYSTDNPKQELYGMLQQRLAPVLNDSFDLEQAGVPAKQRAALQDLADIKGLQLGQLPEVVYLNVQSHDGRDAYYTVLHNVAHRNITALFREQKNLVPEEDTLAVVSGFIGSYPNAYWKVSEKDLPDLVAGVAGLTDEASYAAFMDRYGVRRTSAEFWQHSDKVIAAHEAADPLANGLPDYNRLANQ
jgi:hypothetical protein